MSNKRTAQTRIVRVSVNLYDAIKDASMRLTEEMGADVSNVDASSYIAEAFKKYNKKGGSLL